MHADDVVIFSGNLSAATDMPVLMKFYLAFRNREHIGTIIFDAEPNKMVAYSLNDNNYINANYEK